MKAQSNRQKAAAYADLITEWIAERDRLDDFSRYERNHKIDRSALIQELGFTRSVLGQNPAVKAAIHQAESRWFPVTNDEKINTGTANTLMVPESRLKEAARQNSKLEKENATLRAANAALRGEKLRSSAVEELIARGGRYRPVSCESISTNLKNTIG